MAFFQKTDPAEKLQRDLETKLKAKRANRDDLVARRKVAEAAAAEHCSKASALAADGADDKALSAAENAMRREEDRAATLNRAIGTVEAEIRALEAEIAKVLDQIARAETTAAVSALVEKWGSAGKAFEAAIADLVRVARESAIVIPDAGPLKTFLEAVQAQVPPEVQLVAGVLEGHARAVLAGTTPASLPVQHDPVKPVVIEQPVTERFFAMRIVRWRDAGGVEKIADQYTDCEVTPAAAVNGRRCGALVPVNDPRVSKLRNAHGGRPRPSRERALDLDDEVACQPPKASSPTSVDPVVAANITPFDRGPARKVATAGPGL